MSVKGEVQEAEQGRGKPAGATTSAPLLDHATELRRKIADRTVHIGIIGLGYVGLPLAFTFVERGFRVLGFDVDPAKIESLHAGRNYIKHLQPDRLVRNNASGLF